MLGAICGTSEHTLAHHRTSMTHNTHILEGLHYYIMGQKPIYVIMAAVALFFAGVVTSGGHVRADDGWGAYDSNGNWHCVWQWDSNGHKVCEAYIQQPHIQQVSQWACHDDPNSSDHSCHRIYPFSSEQLPHVQEVAFFPVDDGCNGAFSFPPRCLSN